MRRKGKLDIIGRGREKKDMRRKEGGKAGGRGRLDRVREMDLATVGEVIYGETGRQRSQER